MVGGEELVERRVTSCWEGSPDRSREGQPRLQGRKLMMAWRKIFFCRNRLVVDGIYRNGLVNCFVSKGAICAVLTPLRTTTVRIESPEKKRNGVWELLESSWQAHT